MRRLNQSFAERNGFARRSESEAVNGRSSARNAARRFLSALLALVMTLGSGGVCSARAEETGTGSVERTEFTVYHHYLSGAGTTSVQGYITSANEVHVTYEFGVEKDDTLAGSYYKVLPDPDKAEGGEVDEVFSGFSVGDGDEAVTLVTNSLSTAYAEIHYESRTSNVILHVYYHTDIKRPGVSFSQLYSPGEGDSDKTEVDTRKVDAEMLSKMKEESLTENLNGLKPDDVVYNTSEGLHTNKSVTVDELYEGLIPGRTFDIELESWYAKNEPVDVGLILDASGSMAFLDATQKNVKGISVFGAKNDGGKLIWYDFARGGSTTDTYNDVWKEYGSYVILGSDDVEKLLDSSFTDNTSLSYDGYQYYVYDDRDTVRELVPLGYWDGKTDEGISLPDGLVGMYHFDRDGDQDPNFLKNTAPGADGKANIEEKNDNKHHKTSESADGVEKAGALQLYYKGDKAPDPAKGTIVDLDAEVSDPSNFTISFAVWIEDIETGINVGTDTAPQAQDLVTIKNADTGDELYTILRGTKGTGNSQQHVRWNAKDGSQALDLNNALRSPNASKANYGAYTEKTWRVFTFVVKNGHVTSYVDGLDGDKKNEKAIYYKDDNGPNLAEGKVDFGDAKKLKFTLGGTDEFKSGPALYIDEVYIYDRALKKNEVKTLYDVSTSRATVSDATVDGKYAHFESDESGVVDMIINEKFTEIAHSAGWYYVNSSSHYDDIMDAGSAKNLLFLGVSKTDDGKEEKYPAPKDADGNVANLYDSIERNNDLAGKNAKKTSCLFYFGVMTKEDIEHYGSYGANMNIGDIVLRCVFSSGGGHVGDAPVLVKSLGSVENKHQILDDALNDFFDKLNRAAPDSLISAVRFSSKEFVEVADEKKIVRPTRHQDDLLMQSWTNIENVEDLLSLNRGGKTAKTAKAWDCSTDDDGTRLYNYVMTGGTNAYTGLKEFQEKLQSGNRPGATKYIILFTDGFDNELELADPKITDPEDPSIKKTQAVQLAEELKAADYKIFTVRLDTTEGVEDKEREDIADAFLEAIASRDEAGNALHFVAHSTDELASTFTDDILGHMSFGFPGYTVRHYIDPRFDLIARDSTKFEEIEIIHLHEGGTIHVGKSDSTSAHYDLTTIDGHKVFFYRAGSGYIGAELYYDQDKGLYYLEYEDQMIPRCNVNASSINTWHGYMTLRAKEDFIGGNAVLTEGLFEKQNMVFDPEDKDKGSDILRASSGVERANEETPSKGIRRALVNVHPYEMYTDPTVDVLYAGETVDPKTALQNLFTSAETEIRDLDHVVVPAGGEIYPDGSGYYFEYVRRYLQKHPEKYGKDTVDANFDLFLDELLTGKEVTLPYSFLPAVSVVGDDHDHGTQTGGEAYEADVMGTITYKWALVTDDPTNFDSADTTVMGVMPKRYRMTVKFTPDDEKDRKEPEKDLLEKGRDTAYQTPSDPPNRAIDGKQTDTVHTTYPVSGKLWLMVTGNRSLLEALIEQVGDNRFDLALDVEKKDDSSFEHKEYAFALDRSMIAEAEKLREDDVVFYLSNPELTGLSIGDYPVMFKPDQADNLYFEAFAAANEGDYNRPELGITIEERAPTDPESGPAETVLFRPGAGYHDRSKLPRILAEWVDSQRDWNDPQETMNAKVGNPFDDVNLRDKLPGYLNARQGIVKVTVSAITPAQVTLTTAKTLTGGVANTIERDFTFKLMPAAGNPAGDPVPKAGLTVTATVGNDGVPVPVQLLNKPYYVAGTYVYTVSEVNGGEEGVTYDNRQYTVTVTVSTAPKTAGGAYAVAAVTVAGGGLTEAKTLNNTGAASDGKYAFAMKDANAVFANTCASGTVEVPNLPLTGDNNHLRLWLTLMILSIVGLARRNTKRAGLRQR